MKGAARPLTLAKTELAPNAAFLTSVGKISRAKRYIPLKHMVAPALPNMAKAVVRAGRSGVI